MDKDPLTHNPRDRIAKRCTGIVTIKLMTMAEVKDKVIPGGLNSMTNASKQKYIRRIHNYEERGQIYSTIGRENIRVNATKYPRPS